MGLAAGEGRWPFSIKDCGDLSMRVHPVVNAGS